MTTKDSPQAEQGPYKDDDLVYVDPETKAVVGTVQFGANDQPQSLLVQRPVTPVTDEKKQGEKPKGFWRKVYPWGTYRSMKRIYKIEGKIKDPEPNKTLEDVLPKALSEAFWDWK